ncbi:hypothetical protein [Dankookia sp. P2]|uniref:hypothetical protein n=1 Tax=Dankookia sp. P2 TaxID=3423955 RepID=UPI003D674287
MAADECLAPAIDAGDMLGGCFRIPSVRHHLILRTRKRSVVHHARAADGGIATRIPHDGVPVPDPPGLTLDPAGFFPPG